MSTEKRLGGEKATAKVKNPNKIVYKLKKEKIQDEKLKIKLFKKIFKL